MIKRYTPQGLDNHEEGDPAVFANVEKRNTIKIISYPLPSRYEPGDSLNGITSQLVGPTPKIEKMPEVNPMLFDALADNYQTTYELLARTLKRLGEARENRNLESIVPALENMVADQQKSIKEITISLRDLLYNLV